MAAKKANPAPAPPKPLVRRHVGLSLIEAVTAADLDRLLAAPVLRDHVVMRLTATSALLRRSGLRDLTEAGRTERVPFVTSAAIPPAAPRAE